jgi:Calcineurin-like phosphoesterase
MQKKTIYRLASLFIVISMLFSANLVVHATGNSAPTSATLAPFTPVADAYVISTSATTNYGTATNLRVDSSPVTNSYLRFTVSGVNGATVQSAVLRIYANSANTTGFAVKSVASNTWAENTITYSNAPVAGATIKNSVAFSAAAWVSVDVTSYVKADGTYSLQLSSTNTTNTSLGAREAGANAPQLVVITGTAVATSTPAPGNTPTKTATPNPTSTGVPTATAVSSCTAVVLTKGPTLIYTGDNTKLRVFWQWTSNATFQMQWGTGSTYTSGNVAVTAKNTTTHLYTYDISGLTPGTKYNYRVVTGTQCSSGTFYAAPAASATSLKFTSYGDSRTNGSAHNGIAGQVVSLFKSDPAFQTLNISVGDWVSGDSDSAWMSEWFNPSYTNIRMQDANISDIGIRGNHEGSATFWKQYWPEPFQSGGLYWSFDYGPVHFVMLDAYTAYNAGSAQYNWLKADLAASTKTWKLVAIHEPGWSAGGGHANNTTVQNDLQPLFVQYGVSILFSGHNHYYARASVNGVTHLTLGGGGAPQYTPATGQPNIVVISKSYSFGEFTVSGNTLTAKIVNNSGATIDTFTVTK